MQGNILSAKNSRGLIAHFPTAVVWRYGHFFEKGGVIDLLAPVKRMRDHVTADLLAHMLEEGVRYVKTIPLSKVVALDNDLGGADNEKEEP